MNSKTVDYRSIARVEQNIPENAVNLLFAEDVVSYVMLSFDTSFELVKRSERFRRFVYNAFNETVREAIDFLTRQFNNPNSMKFQILEAVRMNKSVNFLRIADRLRITFFSKGFEARKFLYYCAHVSSMAAIFYSSGITEAPRIAVDEIAESLSGYLTGSGAWDTVNAIAVEYSNMAYTCVYDNSPIDSLIQEHCSNQSPDYCYSPCSRKSSESSEEDFDRSVLNHLCLDEFVNIDNEWKNILLPLLVSDEHSSSSESSTE